MDTDYRSAEGGCPIYGESEIDIVQSLRENALGDSQIAIYERSRKFVPWRSVKHAC